MDFVKHLKETRPPTTKAKSLPSWTPQMRLVLGTVRTSLGKLKDNIHSAQFITRASTPSSLKASIKKFKIPRREDIQPECIELSLCKGYCPAELVAWTDAVVASCRSGAIDDSDEDAILSSQKRIILFAHGGAYCVCSPQTHRAITTKLSKYTNSQVLAIDYRLSPQHTFPAALQDMISAFMFLTDPPPGNRKYRPDQVVFVGDSSGGNLCLAAALWLKKHKNIEPAGLALLSPWIDLSHSAPSFKSNAPYDYLPDQSIDARYIHDDRMHYYLPDNEKLQDALVSPGFATENEFGLLPPTLIQIGDAEKLRDEAIVFSRTFKHSPVYVEMYQDMVHVFHMLSIFDKFSKLAVKRIGEWINCLPVSAQLLKNEVVWIKRDGQKAVLENPLQILVFEKESLQAQGKWADKNEKYYTDIVKPLLEEDNVIQEQQDRDHVPAVGQAEDIDTKIFLPSPSPSPAATA